MEAMIPQHSMAMLTSEHSTLEDVRVRELANGIIKAQRKEIKEREWLIKDISENGKVSSQAQAEQRPLPKFEGTLNKGD